jgi:hypothetical protein
MPGPWEQYQPTAAARPWEQYAEAESPSFASKVGQQAGNLVAGAVRGAGSIGATLLAPVDAAARALNGGQPVNVGGYDIVGQDRRAGMDAGLTELGANTDSLAFKGGKLAGEIAGTAGAGGAIAQGAVRVAPALARIAPNALAALESGGMSAGNAAGATNALLRAGGGAVSGAASAGLVDPTQVAAGGAIGAVLPASLQAAGKVGAVVGGAAATAKTAIAESLMQSALKPTIKQLRTGEAETAVRTLLDYGISPTKKGVEHLKAHIDDINDQIRNEIGSSSATIDKANVLAALGNVRQKFGNQVSPTNDLNAIQRVADDFTAHPAVPPAIPVQVAQDLKQGTYRVLKGKYGEVGSAETEAQKALARGLKEEIATAVPAVGPMNAEESRLLSTLGVAERRALMDMNKNPMGLASLAHNPIGWATFMADRSVAFKALAARMVNRAGVPGAMQGAGVNRLLETSVRAAPAIEADR